MKLIRIFIVSIGVLLFCEFAVGGGVGEVEVSGGVDTMQPVVSSRVIMSSGSMRLVKYTRRSAVGETSYIRREAVDGRGDMRVKNVGQKKPARLVSSESDRRRMQSHYAMNKRGGSVVSYAPSRGGEVGKSSKAVAKPVEGFGNVYKKQGYSHPAYMKSNSKVYGRSPVEQVHYGTRYSGGGIYSSDGVSVSVTVVNGFSWSSGGKGYRGRGSYKRHVNGCGCGCGVKWMGQVGRRGGYGVYGSKPRMVRGGYPRALGDGMYVSKQPRYGYGNYGVRYVARTSNYGHTLTIGGCGGRRY